MKAFWYSPRGEYCKDHTIIQKDGKFHLFSISGRAGTSWWYDSESESRFSHSVSNDLMNWEFIGHCTPARGIIRNGSYHWREDKVWAPHCIFAHDIYWMFYAGVEHPNLDMDAKIPFLPPHIERICLATSKDLYTWERLPQPVFEMPAELIGNPNVIALRDPMVFRYEDHYQWLMYVTVLTIDMKDALGVLKSKDLLNWSFEKLVYISDGMGSITESPFVIEREGLYYLFFNGGYAIAKSPMGPFDSIEPFRLGQSGWGAGEIIMVGGEIKRSIIGGEKLINEVNTSAGGQVAVFNLEWTENGIIYAPLTL